MNKKILIAFLAGFYPALFFLSNNWFVFSFTQNVILLIGSSIVSASIILSSSYLTNYIGSLLYNSQSLIKIVKDNKNNLFIDSIISVFSITLCVYLLRNTLISIGVNSYILWSLILSLVIYFTWSSYYRGLKPLLYLLVILSSLSLLSLMYSIQVNSKVVIDNWTTQNKASYDQIKFQNKPNVYLIISESYSNKPALKSVYGLDNSSFYKEMEELGLKINHNFYSNYNHTLASLSSLFGMEHHFGLIDLGNFDSLGGRRMLEGETYNPVIDIFRANNYKIQYLHNNSALVPNGAHVDYCHPSPTILRGLEVFLTSQNIKETSFIGRETPEDLFQSIRNRIADTADRDESYFNFIYLNFPDHSPSRWKTRSRDTINLELGKFRNAYGEQLESANQKLSDFLKFIINKDQDAVIILIGDHGSWGFRLQEDAQGAPISNELFILDRFGVLAGIRAPKELSDTMNNGSLRSHVNIFKHLFAYLSEDDQILQTKAPDDSYEGPYILAIKDNQILSNFYRVKP